MAEPVQAVWICTQRERPSRPRIGLRDVENGQSHEGASIGFRSEQAGFPLPKRLRTPVLYVHHRASSVVRLHRCRI